MLRTLPLLAALLQAVPIRAQEPLARIPNGTAVGGSAGVFLIERETIYTMGLTVTGLRAGRVSADFALVLPPEMLREGAVVFAVDVAPAYNLALPGATLLVKAGPSVVVGAGAVAGLQGGLGVILQLAPKAGLRIDLLERVYLVSGQPYALPSVSIGFTSLLPTGA